jgi:hypothetical protein
MHKRHHLEFVTDDKLKRLPTDPYSIVKLTKYKRKHWTS